MLWYLRLCQHHLKGNPLFERIQLQLKMHAPVLVTSLLASLVLAANASPRNVVPWIGGYQLVRANLTWTQADSLCAALGGQLAFPQTPAEASKLSQLLYAQGVDQAHIGFHDLFTENEYFTVLGQSLDQVGYQNGAHSVVDAADCGSLHFTGLQSVACDAELHAICQSPPLTDYDLVAGFGYYKLSSGRALWADAMRTCREEGADLLVMHSVEEYDALISKYLNMTTGFWVHYGAHHAFADQRFVTIFGEPLEQTGFATWGAYEPSGSNVEKPYLAVAIPGNSRDRGLALMETSFSDRFICKRPLHP